MSKLKKADFLDASADFNTRGKRKNWLEDGQPDEPLNISLFDSMAMFDEAGSRANLDTGGVEFKDEVGLVAITTPAKAKAGTSGFEADRTLVVEASQLPTSDATDVQAITGPDPFSDVILDVSADATPTKNNYLSKISTPFLVWFQALKDKVYTNSSAITINAGNISTNTGNISANTGNIATNTGNIATNTATGSTNAGNISTNSSNIGTNTANISTNTGNIATNTGNIATNVTNIGANVLDIATNVASIGVLNAKVGAISNAQLPLSVWDMDTNASSTITHGLSVTEVLTISNISVLIFPDSGTTLYPLDAVSSSTVLQGGVESISSTIITISRFATGIFDVAGYSALGTSRGIIRFNYIAD